MAGQQAQMPRQAHQRRRPARAVIDSSQGRSPFLFQLPFLVLIVLILGAVAVFAPGALGRVGVFASLAIVMVATTLALVVPWSRLLPQWVVAVIPLLDIMAVPFLRESLGEPQINELLIIPVVWMSAQYYVAGVVISSSAAVLAIWSTVLLNPERLSNVAMLWLLPAVIIVAGGAIALISRRGGATQVMLEQQSLLTERALERVSRQRRLLDGILNAMSIGVLALDQNGEPTIVNRRQRRLLGRDFGGRLPTIRDIEATFYDADLMTPLESADDPIQRARTGETFDNLLVWQDSVVMPDEKRALNVTARQIRSEHGEPAGAVVVFQDVTAEIEALRAREDLVASVSHELRTPLTSIVGFLELLEDDEELPPESRQLVTVVSSNADRLLKIVSDLLVAAQDADTAPAISTTSIDLEPLVVDGMKLIEARARDADIHITSTIPDGVEVLGDPRRLRQVIDNVLSNAVKYGRTHGHVWISTAERTSDDDSSMIVLTVRDDGIGISAEDQNKLFSRFYRAATVRRSTVHGAGLGLHISRTIMRQHGGDIHIVSEPSVGTTVEIIVPQTQPVRSLTEREQHA